MSENTRLKDIFFSDAFLQQLAGDLAKAYPAFDVDDFLFCARGDGFADKSLKGKMRHTTGCLRAALPQEYEPALGILLAVAPNYPDFDGMVFSDYVACYGLDNWALSLPALREFTRTISAEFAIRPFLRDDPPRALPYLNKWSQDPDPAVRRLASEGSRPRLPWGMALPAFKKDPTPILPILDRLKDDPSEDVRRSVANNLNDITKDNPQLVLDIAESWYGQDENVDRVVKHACRTLLKAGNVRAMRLFDFAAPLNITVRDLLFDPPQLAVGEEMVINFCVDVETAEPFLLRLEYAITFARAKGKTSRKVFHLRESNFTPGLHRVLRKQSFRDLSTRKHYPGEHKLEIIVNGVTKESGHFTLTT